MLKFKKKMFSWNGMIQFTGVTLRAFFRGETGLRMKLRFTVLAGLNLHELVSCVPGTVFIV